MDKPSINSKMGANKYDENVCLLTVYVLTTEGSMALIIATLTLRPKGVFVFNHVFHYPLFVFATLIGGG